MELSRHILFACRVLWKIRIHGVKGGVLWVAVASTSSEGTYGWRATPGWRRLLRAVLHGFGEIGASGAIACDCVHPIKRAFWHCSAGVYGSTATGDCGCERGSPGDGPTPRNRVTGRGPSNGRGIGRCDGNGCKGPGCRSLNGRSWPDVGALPIFPHCHGCRDRQTLSRAGGSAAYFSALAADVDLPRNCGTRLVLPWEMSASKHTTLHFTHSRVSSTRPSQGPTASSPSLPETQSSGRAAQCRWIQ